MSINGVGNKTAPTARSVALGNQASHATKPEQRAAQAQHLYAPTPTPEEDRLARLATNAAEALGEQFMRRLRLIASEFDGDEAGFLQLTKADSAKYKKLIVDAMMKAIRGNRAA